MNIDELKNRIENKETLPNILIFKYKSNYAEFLFHQYIEQYSLDNDLDLRYKEDLSDLSVVSLFEEYSDNTLYIYETSKLELVPSIKDKLWIKCTSIPKKLVDEYSDIIIELPKIEEWQIKDYIEFNSKKLTDLQRNKLYNHYKSDLFRLELELDKLKLDENEVWYNTIEDQLYVDSTEYNIFDITNCILKRDLQGLINLKNDINLIDIDAFGFLKILLTNFRYVIDIQLAKNTTPEYVGVSNKQFWAIKNYSCGYYTKDELVYIYKFLLTLDSKIKFGEIPINMVIDYVISKIMLLK